MLPANVIEEIRKYALKNAMDYGNAKDENVLAKVARSVPKDMMVELRAEVSKTVSEVNSLAGDELKRQYGAYSDEFAEAQERRAESTSKPRMVLEGATKGDFATRFAPEPSGYIHVGHASAAFLAQEFSRIYDGKLFLYFDDTNPEKESQEFVDSIKSDMEWLGIGFDKEYYASDNMSTIYECARKLIESNKAYACECRADQIKEGRFNGKECVHRSTTPKENMDKFEKMLDKKYEEEKIVVRIKGDMSSKNTALRDPTILRVKNHRHYRQGDKYAVWPTYDFNTPINDSKNGVTDAIRTKEYELRGESYDMVLNYLGMRIPRMHLHGRIAIKGQPRQKREIRKLISDGYIKGYNDPRLVTIAALRRRGIQPEAIREFVLGFGTSLAESTVDIAPLLSYNRHIIDAEARRLYYVPAPIDIEIKNLVQKDIELKLHPSKDLGSRKYSIQNRFYISGSDASMLKDGDVIRLKELFNVKVKWDYDSWTGEIVEPESERRLQWVCDGNYLKCKVLVPGEVLDGEGNFNRSSLQVNEGYIESYAANLEKGDIIQMERFGFCILDDKDRMQFIFISK
ncbi:MAG: glutamate--tRNA ligase [Candidatus Micrarchaeaceae archaeon]